MIQVRSIATVTAARPVSTSRLNHSLSKVYALSCCARNEVGGDISVQSDPRGTAPASAWL